MTLYFDTTTTVPVYNNPTPINTTALYPAIIYGASTNVTLSSSTVLTIASNVLQITLGSTDFQAIIGVVYASFVPYAPLSLKYGLNGSSVGLSSYCLHDLFALEMHLNYDKQFKTFSASHAFPLDPDPNNCDNECGVVTSLATSDIQRHVLCRRQCILPDFTGIVIKFRLARIINA